ncbi:RNA polymerase sigma factor [Bradyrhizobium sp. Arg237L]|uniref:RNA polymerase sigma factor n=1 Tax=Bradyrhizobium sp. Arg237L TaxID=3003352 RepID=UPI00249F4F6C|nr:RNA polymerase sigma factor [Bradyrhizobium sp. Arg237L]MDI4236714.1 RNA polymerase sigma factor [Bradyrhizobium sp. Arg237L]
MTEAGWAALQRRLLTRYGDLKKRLTRYLGSADLANEALHDTWLRLERGGELTTVRNPDTYLYSMAINIASNLRRAENRRLTAFEVEALLEIGDDAPDAARVLVARTELEALVHIIGELPVRQQAVLLAARLEGVPRREIATRFGVSERFVQRELQAAHDYCATRLEEMMSERFRSVPRAVSSVQKAFGLDGKMPTRSGTDDQ